MFEVNLADCFQVFGMVVLLVGFDPNALFCTSVAYMRQRPTLLNKEIGLCQVRRWTGVNQKQIVYSGVVLDCRRLWACEDAGSGRFI